MKDYWADVEPSADLCPQCGHVNDAATHLNAEPMTPAAGDVSICLYCSAVCVFTGEGYAVRLPTAAELAEFMSTQQIIDALATLLEFRNSDAWGAS